MYLIDVVFFSEFRYGGGILLGATVLPLLPLKSTARN
jgi:hypothetical protein